MCGVTVEADLLTASVTSARLSNALKEADVGKRASSDEIFALLTTTFAACTAET